MTELETEWSPESKVCPVWPFPGEVCQAWFKSRVLRIQIPVRNELRTRQLNVPNAYENNGIFCCCCFKGEGAGRLIAFNLQDYTDFL